MHPTPNSVRLIAQNAKSHPHLKYPILQILTIDKHINAVNDQERIKATLSDGTHYIKSIFSTKYTKHFDSAIKQNSLIKIGSFEVRGKGSVFVYVTELMDFCDHGEMIGKPVNVNGKQESEIAGEVFSRQSSVKVEKVDDKGLNGKGKDEIQANIEGNKVRNEPKMKEISERQNNDDYKKQNNRGNIKDKHENKYNMSENNLGMQNQENFDRTMNDQKVIDQNSNKKKTDTFPPKTPISNPISHPTKMVHKDLTKQTPDSPAKKHNTGITAIRDLNPFTHNFELKGRCLSKSEVKTFKNQKGEGKLFSMVLADDTGTIKLAGFSEAVDMFYELVDVNKVYKISGGQVRMANKKFSNTTSEYEVHLDKNTKLNLVYDEATPKYYFKFVKMGDLCINHTVDVVGVVKDVFTPGKVTVKSTGKETSKRDLNLVDDTGIVRATLWGRNAETDVNVGDCLVLSNVLVKEYNGVCLSTSSSSSVYVNLLIDECYTLKGWYEEEGKNLKFERKTRDDPKLIADIKEHEIKYSQFVGTVVYVKEDNLFYNSCLECNKKVLEEDGQFRCERCNKTTDTCYLRYLAKFEVGDFTEQIWISAFDEQCKLMMGIDAKDLEPENVKALYYKDFMFKATMKAENYQGETRNKFNVREVEPVNYQKETKRLLQCIKESL